MRKSVVFLIIFVLSAFVLTVSAKDYAVATPQLPPPPTDPTKLPNELLEHIRFEQPVDNCWKNPDPNRTCSLEQQQSFAAKVTLQPGEIRYMTGDAIYALMGSESATATSAILTPEGVKEVPAGEYATSLSPEQMKALVPNATAWTPIVPRLADVTYVETDVWTLDNASDKPVDFYMVIPFGGYFGDAGVPVVVKAADAMLNGRDLHVNKMIYTNAATIKAVAASNGEMIYPHVNPANCADVTKTKVNEITYCPGVNSYSSVWDGKNWTTVSYGFAYKGEKGELNWVDYSALLSKKAPSAR